MGGFLPGGGGGSGNAFIGARGYRITNFIVEVDTVTPLPIEVLSFNIGGCVNLAAQPSRFVAVEAGVYLFGGSVLCEQNGLQLYVRVNGEDSPISGGDAGVAHVGIVSTVLQLAANDYAELILYSEEGGEAGVFGEITGAWMSRLS